MFIARHKRAATSKTLHVVSIFMTGIYERIMAIKMVLWDMNSIKFQYRNKNGLIKNNVFPFKILN